MFVETPNKRGPLLFEQFEKLSLTEATFDSNQVLGPFSRNDFRLIVAQSVGSQIRSSPWQAFHASNGDIFSSKLEQWHS